MQVIVKRVGEAQELVDVQGDVYNTLQSHIGGWFEHIELEVDGTVVDVWLDEEGKLKNLPINLRVPGDVLVGPLVFTGGADAEGRTLGVSPSIVEAVTRLLNGTARSVDWA